MQKAGVHTSSANINTTMTVDTTADTRASTFLDDEPIASDTYIASSYLVNIPHAHVITLPTYSLATYYLTLLASRHLR